MFATLFGVPDCAPPNSIASCGLLSPFPNTDINDGNEASSDPDPFVAGILDSGVFVGDALAREIDRCGDGLATKEQGEFALKRSSECGSIVVWYVSGE